MKILVKKLHKDAKIPSYAHPGDAGMDLFSLEEVVLEPRTPYSIPTGIALEIPEGCAALIWDKSGLAMKGGLKTLGGVIDSGYRGEVKVGMINLSDSAYVLERGHKVAQMLIQRVEYVVIKEVEELSDTRRGDGGFGSTGR